MQTKAPPTPKSKSSLPPLLANAKHADEFHVRQCAAVCCSVAHAAEKLVRQCVTVCCSVLQCVAVQYAARD